MKSIFNATDNNELIERINHLTPNSKPLWGKMTVEQMLMHCQGPMDVAFGTLELKMNFVMSLMGKLFKNSILKSKEFKKNSPTVKEFISKDTVAFDLAKRELIQKINTFSLQKETAIKNFKHPFFGKLTSEEWSKLQIMHLDHHLKQFGV